MTYWRALAVLTAALIIDGAAVAQSNGTQIRYVGEISCGSWPSALKATDVEKALPLNLVLGVLAGKSFETGDDLLSVADVYSISLWMDNYCRENPLNSIVEGSFELEAELRGRLPSSQ